LTNLVDLAIEAHCGLKLWPEIKEVELRLSLSGVLFQNQRIPRRPAEYHDEDRRARTADVDFALSANRVDRQLRAAADLD
jgi:hypothetical protein